jgi:UDP-N-acetylglucosamine--N-acetylmuramyl-(pentapeptide) pyrophosphoryl-undecaprenol N-acetylglucosamine transferase
MFIPYPYAAADHQTHNANYMVSKGAALMIPQTKLTADLLVTELTAILNNDERLRAMRKAMTSEGKSQASRDLAGQLKEISTAFQIKQSKVLEH